MLVRQAWTPANFSLGRATLPVAAVAVVWAVLQFVNIAWPRAAFEQRYLDWSVWIGIAVLLVLGTAILAGVRSRIVEASVIDEVESRDELADVRE